MSVGRQIQFLSDFLTHTADNHWIFRDEEKTDLDSNKCYYKRPNTMISEINGSTEVPLTHPREAENSGKGGCVLCLCLCLFLPFSQMSTYCELHCAPHQQVFLFRMSLRLCVQVDSNPEWDFALWQTLWSHLTNILIYGAEIETLESVLPSWTFSLQNYRTFGAALVKTHGT